MPTIRSTPETGCIIGKRENFHTLFHQQKNDIELINEIVRRFMKF